MSSVRPSKKANVFDATADNAVSSTGLDLSPELIARVTTFVNVWTPDVWNTCLAAGPVVSRNIRHCYLKNNTDFLEKTLENFHSRCWNKAKARTNHLAWMAVNSDWRDKITDARMEDLKEACSREHNDLWLGLGRYQHKVNSYLALNNAAIAIQLGLLDVLKYLVEEKLVDINSHQWTGYFSTQKLPLLCYCAGYDGDYFQWEQDIEAYHYLLGLPCLDIVEHVDRLFQSLFPLRLFPLCGKHIYRSALPFVRGLVHHSTFSRRINDNMIVLPGYPDHKESPLSFLLGRLLGVLVARRLHGPAFEDAYKSTKMLLEAGADPNLRNVSHGGHFSAVEYWEDLMKQVMEENLDDTFSVDCTPSYDYDSAREKCRAEYWDKVTVLLQSYR